MNILDVLAVLPVPCCWGLGTDEGGRCCEIFGLLEKVVKGCKVVPVDVCGFRYTGEGMNKVAGRVSCGDIDGILMAEIAKAELLVVLLLLLLVKFGKELL